MIDNTTHPGGQATRDARLEESLEQIRERIKIDAKNTTGKPLSPLNNRQLIGFFEEFHLGYQQLIDDNARDGLVKSTCDQVAEDKGKTDAGVHEFDNQLHDVQQRQIVTNAALKCASSPYSHGRVLIIWLIVFFVMQFDGVLSMSVWEALGLSFITALWAGVIFAAALSVLSCYFEQLVQKGKTLFQKRLIGFGIMGFVTILFSLMAAYRANYTNQELNAYGIHTTVSPVLFVVLSMFFFSVAVIAKHLGLPSKAQQVQKRQYDRLVMEKDINEALARRLSAQKEALKQEHTVVRKNATEKLERAANTESYIISCAHEGYVIWRKYFQNNHPNYLRPPSFDGPYPHTFKTYFHTINQL